MDHAIHRLYYCINRYALLVKNFLSKSFRPSGYEGKSRLVVSYRMVTKMAILCAFKFVS